MAHVHAWQLADWEITKSRTRTVACLCIIAWKIMVGPACGLRGAMLRARSSGTHASLSTLINTGVSEDL